MRPDLNKLLCKRERPGSKSKYKHKRKNIENRFFRDLDSAPTRLSRKDIYGYKHDFNENLNPLRNFLHGAVGRKWDDIYSEMSSVLNKDSVINQHVFQHVYDFVEKDCKMGDDGKVYWLDKGRRTWGRAGAEQLERWRIIEESNSDLYIHPKSGLLLEVDKSYKIRETATDRKRDRDLLATVYKFISNEIRLLKIAGTWYEFKMMLSYYKSTLEIVGYDADNLPIRKMVQRILPNGCMVRDTIDVALSKEGYWYSKPAPHDHPLVRARFNFKFGDWYLDYKKIQTWAGVSKRQLNSKDLKKYGLTN